jgi:hypothetical protein
MSTLYLPAFIFECQQTNSGGNSFEKQRTIHTVAAAAAAVDAAAAAVANTAAAAAAAAVDAAAAAVANTAVAAAAVDNAAVDNAAVDAVGADDGAITVWHLAPVTLAVSTTVTPTNTGVGGSDVCVVGDVGGSDVCVVADVGAVSIGKL